jgi:heme/copper-type cytochrome/quinol oxidase subunit 2
MRQSLLIVLVAALALPGTALGHDAPENTQSKWVMADWMMDTFFIFAGLAFVAFLVVWKTGHFHELDSHASIPLYVEEEDYYTPEWALAEEEWADGDAER